MQNKIQYKIQYKMQKKMQKKIEIQNVQKRGVKTSKKT